MRVGKRILGLMEVADANGSVSSILLRGVWPEVQDSNRCKYLARAVALGLIEVIDKDAYPKQYRAVDGWRDRVFGEVPRKYERTGCFTKEAIQARKMPMVNSVFALGSALQ